MTINKIQHLLTSFLMAFFVFNLAVNSAFSQTGSLEVDGSLKVNQDLCVNGVSFLWNNRVDIGHFNDVPEIPGMSIFYEDGGFSTTKFLSNRWGSEWIWQNGSPTGIKDRMKLDNYGSLFLYGDDGGMTLPNIYLSPTFGYGHYPMIKLESDSQNIQIGGDANGITINGKKVLVEGLDSSTALGYNPIASGSVSVSLGNANTASGNSSVAMGWNNRAIGDRSFAAGEYSEASGFRAIAMGAGNISSGQASVAIGQSNFATNLGAVALGHFATASGYISFATGEGSLASGNYSISMGSATTASGLGSFTGGRNSEATKENGVALGYWARSRGLGAVAIGNSIANGDYSATLGHSNSVDGNQSVTIGSNSQTSGLESATIGSWSNAEGYRSFIIGAQLKGRDFQTVVGVNNFPLGALGTGVWNPLDPVFIVGNGIMDSNPEPNRSNALVVLKNGDTTVYGNLESTKKITAQDISATGKIIVPPQGDLSMGEFTAGGQ